MASDWRVQLDCLTPIAWAKLGGSEGEAGGEDRAPPYFTGFN